MADPAVSPTASHPAAKIPTHTELFFAFVRITLSGFGGTLPWTRRMFIEQKKWMTAEEFNDAYALCQILPGPNIVNLTTIFGSRLHGATGAVACWAGFIVMPFIFMTVLGTLYAKYGDVDLLRRFLAGIAVGASGLLIATAAKMAMPLFKRIGPAPLLMLVTMFAIGVMRWPLLAVMLAMAPVSLAMFAWVRR